MNLPWRRKRFLVPVSVFLLALISAVVSWMLPPSPEKQAINEIRDYVWTAQNPARVTNSLFAAGAIGSRNGANALRLFDSSTGRIFIRPRTSREISALTNEFAQKPSHLWLRGKSSYYTFWNRSPAALRRSIPMPAVMESAYRSVILSVLSSQTNIDSAFFYRALQDRDSAVAFVASFAQSRPSAASSGSTGYILLPLSYFNRIKGNMGTNRNGIMIQLPISQQQGRIQSPLLMPIAVPIETEGETTIRELKSGGAVIRARAASKLGTLHDPIAVPHLIQLLEDSALEVQLCAVRSIRELAASSKIAAAPLREKLKSAAGDLKKEIEATIQAIERK